MSRPPWPWRTAGSATSRRLWLGFGMLTALLLLLGLAILIRLLSIERQIGEISQARNLSAAARQMEVNALGYALAVREYAQNRDPQVRQDAAREAAKVERQLRVYRRFATTDRQRGLAARLTPSWRQLRALGRELLDADGDARPARAGTSAAFYADRIALEQLLDDEVQADAVEVYNTRRYVALSDLRTIAAFSLVLLALGVIVAVVTGTVVSRGIVRGERALWASRERLRVTLASIGDAVVTTDTRGRVSYLNAVAESLTGWDSDAALGLPLEEVFRIIDEHQRQPVESPATRALREGVIVGLANHTVLITRDGKERPIDDSAAPIHGVHGEVLGVVLIFRDVTERRENEKMLSQAHRRKDAMFEAALDCIISTDHQDTIIEFNAAAERTFGYRREQVLGRPLGEVIIPPAYRERHRKGVAHYLATGEGPILDQRLELSALHADGSEFPVELTVTRIPVEGAPVFTAYLRDITDRKRAEAALAESEARWRGIFERLHEGFVLGEIVHDQHGKPVDWRYLEMNASWEGITGLSREFARGRTLTEVVPGVEPEWIDEFAAVAATGQPANILRHVAALDRWYEVHAFRPEPGRFAALFMEVTDRQNAEIRLRESESRLRFVLDSMPQKIFTATPDGDIDYFNPQWTEFTGLTLEQILGWGWTQFLHPDDADETVARWRHAVDTGESFGIEHRFRRADGQYRWHVSRGRPLRDGAGAVVMWIGSNTDIDEQKRVTQELSQADRRKNEFLAMLAHELRNPLAPIRNALQILRLTEGDANTVAAMREIMDRQVDQMVRLVDDLVDVSRISRGKISLQREYVELAPIIEQAVEASRAAIEHAGHELTVALPPQPVRLHADPARLAQVFGNLIGNACKYTEPGGHISISVEDCGGEVRVAVIDTGVGIAAEMLPNVFKMFTQVDQSLERSQGGLGIGLTLVQRLVELHGGTVTASSEGPGRGSEFVVRLPTAPTPPADARVAAR